MALSAINRYHLKRAYKRISPIIKHKKTASYFTITLSLFSLSFFGLFAIRPTLITAVSLIKNVSDLKKLSIQYENKISNIVRAQSEYEQLRILGGLSLIESALPTNASFHKIAKALEKFAQNSNISINQLQIDSVPISNLPEGDKMKDFSFSLTATGDYPSVFSYIQHITNWKRIVTINSIEFSQHGSTTSGELKFVLKGKTYYEP